MRTIVMFDLPTLTLGDLREYRAFRRFLIKNGFIMLQESIYTKLSLNAVGAEQVKKLVKKHLPKDGLVQMLTITEKQFASMELLLGKSKDTYCDSDKRILML
ncbi:MAG: CRISPR-associated endonuclease Cas2 [Clostridia bacterium]|nr:CRISPR-associated endonuclease Cas2 [Clostridia bacterium]